MGSSAYLLRRQTRFRLTSRPGFSDEWDNLLSSSISTVAGSARLRSELTMAECQLCGAFAPSPAWCPDCQALAYCGVQHLKRHSRDVHGGSECDRMRKQMQSSDAIKSKGLEYSALLAAEAPDEDHICFLLEVLGVHCCGPYACLCKCGNDQRVCANCTPLMRVFLFSPTCQSGSCMCSVI